MDRKDDKVNRYSTGRFEKLGIAVALLRQPMVTF